MKISLDDINKKGANRESMVLFQKLDIKDIDWDVVENIKLNDMYQSDFCWLIKNFKLTLSVTFVDDLYDCDDWTTIDYKDGLMLKKFTSCGDCIKIKYNQKGQTVYFEKENKYCNTYKYNSQDQLIKVQDNNNKYIYKYTYNDTGKLINIECCDQSERPAKCAGKFIIERK